MSRKKSVISKDFSDRLLLLMRHFGYKNRQHAQFARKIGVSDGFLSDVLNLKSGPSFSLVSGISNEFPSANMRWLLTGEGLETLKKGSKKGRVLILSEPVPSYGLQMDNLLQMAGEVLGSGTDYAWSLAANIRCFYNAVKTEKELVSCKRSLSDHEKRLMALEGKDRDIEGATKHKAT